MFAYCGELIIYTCISNLYIILSYISTLVTCQISDSPSGITMPDSLIHLLIHSPDPEIRRATLIALVRQLSTTVPSCRDRVDMMAHLSSLIRQVQEAP